MPVWVRVPIRLCEMLAQARSPHLEDVIVREAVPRRIGFDLLKTATNEFSTKIGAGATGEVFWGNLDGVPVAVKRLRASGGRDQLEQRFLMELNVLRKCVHPRIVRLLCYAIDEDVSARLPFALGFEAKADRSRTGCAGPAMSHPLRRTSTGLDCLRWSELIQCWARVRGSHTSTLMLVTVVPPSPSCTVM
jgi:hypothetical protein